ncbi:hypothetical protein GF373_12370, partial [bacterium]|nr:hypothetical protein [bacterium]
MRRHVLFFFVFLLCVTVTQVLLAQDTPMRYDFGAETAQANAIQLMGPGFSQDEANRASIEFGPIPTDQAFADATDGTGAMITAQPGQGILILGQPIRVGKAAMMRCSIRADWKTAFPILGALDADLYEAGGGDFLITTTINNGNHVWGRYRRMTVFFTPPTSGFIPLIQVVNKSKTNSVRIFIDNLDIYLLEPDRFYRGDFLNGDEDDPAITSASIHNFVRTPIPTPSFTPSHTPTPSQTSTPTHTPLPTHTPTPSFTPSQTPTWTFTPTYTFTNTPT